MTTVEENRQRDLAEREAIAILFKLYRETRQAILRHAADYLYVNAVGRMSL